VYVPGLVGGSKGTKKLASWNTRTVPGGTPVPVNVIDRGMFATMAEPELSASSTTKVFFAKVASGRNRRRRSCTKRLPVNNVRRAQTT
jgi:hypothetical protein